MDEPPSVQVQCTDYHKGRRPLTPRRSCQRKPPLLFFPPFQTGRCRLAVTDSPAVTVDSLRFVPNESCFRRSLLVDWSCSPGSHWDGSFVLVFYYLFKRVHPEFRGKKRKNISNLFSCLARLTHYTGTFIINIKLISQQI